MINEETILDEQKFPYIYMSLEERNQYLNIIRNCKDICDSENKVNDISKCEIIGMRLIKEDNDIIFNGMLKIGNENRTIEGRIFFDKNRIFVDSLITRVGMEKEHKIYTVLDEFKLEDTKIIRRSQYNYNMKSIYDIIDNDDDMKGRLKK